MMKTKIGIKPALLLLALMLSLISAVAGPKRGPIGVSVPSQDRQPSRTTLGAGTAPPILLAANEGCSLKTYNLDLGKNPGMLPEALRRRVCPDGCQQGMVGTAGDFDCDGKLEFSVAGDNDWGDFCHCKLYDDSDTGFSHIPNDMWIGCDLTILSESHQGYHNLRSAELKCGKAPPDDCRTVTCIYQWNGQKYVKKSCGKK